MTALPFLPQEVIRKKRDGETLSRDEIVRFVDGTVSGSVGPSQIGAFTMAVYLNGMSRDERVAYALAMRDSGRVIDWSEIGLSGPTSATSAATARSRSSRNEVGTPTR